jgi:class 3 adenylate cyclase
LEIAETAGAVGARIHAQANIGLALGVAGRFTEGIAALDKSFEEAVQLGDIVLAAMVLNNGTVQRFFAGRIDEMPARLELFSKVPDDPVNRVRRLQLSGFHHLAAGHPASALECFDQVIAIATDAGIQRNTARGRMLRAEALYDLDRLSEARAELPAASAIQERVGIGLRALVGAELAIGEGDLVAATREAALIFEMTGVSLWFRVMAGWVAVDAFARAGDLAAARRAASLAMEEQPEDLRPWVDLIAGTLALGLRDSVTAIPALRGSADAFRSKGGKRLEWIVRLALVRALLQSGEVESAIDEARLLHEETTRAGSSRAARMAAELLVELGVSQPKVDPQLARPIAQEDDLRQASERLVTVMFVDVRGYTAMTAKEAPHEMVEKLTTFLRWSGQEIKRHHGLVDQYAGDAVLAIFNVSGVRLDHALHALQAALAIRDKAAYAGLPVGIGIAVGPAIVGQLATGANVTAVGETTNLASRLQGQAEAGEILLSAETYRRVRDWLAGSAYEPVEARLVLKGFTEPVVAQRLRRQHH